MFVARVVVVLLILMGINPNPAESVVQREEVTYNNSTAWWATEPAVDGSFEYWRIEIHVRVSRRVDARGERVVTESVNFCFIHTLGDSSFRYTVFSDCGSAAGLDIKSSGVSMELTIGGYTYHYSANRSEKPVHGIIRAGTSVDRYRITYGLADLVMPTGLTLVNGTADDVQGVMLCRGNC